MSRSNGALSSSWHGASDRAGQLRKATGLVILPVVAFFLALPSVAQGQVGLGLTAGTEYGFGGVVEVGAESFRVDVGGGILPTFVWVRSVGFGDDIIKFYFPGAVGAQVSIRVSGEEDERLGLRLGGRYTTLSKFGFGGGVDFVLGDKVRGASGLMIHPEAEEELRLRINEEEGRNFTEDEFSAPLTLLQLYASVTLMLF